MRMPIRAAIAMPLIIAAALVSATTASAAPRMPVGFQDDPTLRWSDQAPDELDAVQATHATIVRTTANWAAIAPTRPRTPADSFDPAYRWTDLDDLARNAQKRGIELLITIWGTPKWANGGQKPTVAPKKLADLTSFARALADRYSGRHPGYPYVGRYSVWNEPNLGIFLSPQFDAKGRIVSPRIYAGLYKAAYAGLKAGNKTALVAIGETSNRGRDHPLKGAPVSVAPATFARLLAQQKGLRFDAYATHPYATTPSAPPTQKVKWPNVTLSQLKRFESSLDTWFHRKDVPVWITEYGYQTKPAEPAGVTEAKQASYLSYVMRTLRADPHVHMLIWFGFRDSPGNLWHSGLYTSSGRAKPALRTFTTLAKSIAGETETVQPGETPTITLAVPQLAFTTPVGSMIGVTYRVYQAGKLIAVGQPAAPLRTNQTITFPADFKPAAGKTYTVDIEANDANGNSQSATFALVTGTAR